MISVDVALVIHNSLIDDFGGSKGIRDRSLLESALARPFVTFDSVELYENPIEKAAALLQSIVINHPFIDGNKRTGFMLMLLLLDQYDLDVAASQQERYTLVIAASKGEYRYEQIKNWIKSKIISF